MACSRSLRTEFPSTSSNRLDPPCRSSPSTMWRCAQDGQVRSVLSEKKFGTAKRHTIAAATRIAAAFHREKNNTDAIGLVTAAPPPPQSREAARSGGPHRLALRPRLGLHRAHLPHA